MLCPERMQSEADKSNIREALVSFSSAHPANILFTNSSSPWQQGKVLPSCRWKGTGYFHHAKGAALPTHCGKLNEVGTVKDLPFCSLYSGTAGKEGTPALSLTHSLAGAAGGMQVRLKSTRSWVQIQPCSAETCSHFTAKLKTLG